MLRLIDTMQAQGNLSSTAVRLNATIFPPLNILNLQPSTGAAPDMRGYAEALVIFVMGSVSDMSGLSAQFLLRAGNTRNTIADVLTLPIPSLVVGSMMSWGINWRTGEYGRFFQPTVRFSNSGNLKTVTATISVIRFTGGGSLAQLGVSIAN